MSTIMRTERFAGAAAQALCVLLACVVVATIQLFSATPARSADDPVAVAIRATGDENVTRIVMEFEGEVAVSHQLLGHPERLVLDLPKIGYGFAHDDKNLGGLATHMRWGDMSGDVSRIIIDMAAPFMVTSIKPEPPDNRGISRWFIDVERTDADTFHAEIDRTMKTGAITRTTDKSDRIGVTGPVSSDVFTVIIDPGHGGIDDGAHGMRTREKDITLKFGRELRDALKNSDPSMRVFLTRDSDVFIPLRERVRFARQHNASLFISVHADSVRQKYVRGATVYTISEKASDSVAAEIARSENASDLIAGITFTEEEDEVSDILVDLTRRETVGFSVRFARIAIEEMRKVTRIIKNPHRYAGFRVLKAPDVPSVLVELGYLSNREDEKLLNDMDWRAQMADRLAGSVVRYAQLTGHVAEAAVQTD